MIGLMADVISANRKILEDAQYHARRAEYEAIRRERQREADPDRAVKGAVTRFQRQHFAVEQERTSLQL